MSPKAMRVAFVEVLGAIWEVAQSHHQLGNKNTCYGSSW